MITAMVRAFLHWPLPLSVHADGSATQPGPGRLGVNLLTAGEAEQMLRAVVLPLIPDQSRLLSLVRGGHRLSLDRRDGHFRVNCNGTTRASFNASCTNEVYALADAIAFLKQVEKEALQHPTLDGRTDA